jgi:hypothetical protein
LIAVFFIAWGRGIMNIEQRVVDEPCLNNSISCARGILHERHTISGYFVRFCVLISMSSIVSGCNWVGSLGGPDRITPVTEEVGMVKAYVDSLEPLAYAATGNQIALRNNIISARMYVIDMEYTQYESQLMREGQIVDFSTKLTSGVLTTTAGLIPAVGASHALSETATLVNGLDSAYNDKVLKSQIIQNVLASMRTARHDQAAILFANMYCPITVYPIGFALSDLETYYRAGTFQTGLIKLTQTVSKAETDSKANQDTNKPAPTADAKATLAANATAANVKAGTKTPSQKAAGGSSASAACKAPATTSDVSYYLPKQGDPTAKKDAPTNLAGQPAPKSQF